MKPLGISAVLNVIIFRTTSSCSLKTFLGMLSVCRLRELKLLNGAEISTRNCEFPREIWCRYFSQPGLALIEPFYREKGLLTNWKLIKGSLVFQIPL